MTDHRFMLEMMPYVISITAISLFFLYLIARVVFLPRRERKLRKLAKKYADAGDHQNVDQLLSRAIDLEKRIAVLEEILEEERSQKVP